MTFMVCYDGSDASREALRVARSYAKKFSATIHVVCSLAPTAEGEKPDWGGLKGEIEAEGGKCVVADLEHDATDGENLVEYAQREAVDSVFIGVRRVSKVGKLLFGSTAQYVILGAPCPVISVKAASPAGT